MPLSLFKVRESIAELLILCLQIDVEREYQKHNDERTRNKIVLQFCNLKVAESVYVECFKRGGHMHTDIMELVCKLWSKD